jgi:hypothetical protein
MAKNVSNSLMFSLSPTNGHSLMQFLSVLQAHMVNMWKSESDSSRCDWQLRLARRATLTAPSQQVAQPVTQPVTQPAAQPVTQPAAQPVAQPLTTATPMSLSDLACRPPNSNERTFRNAYTIERSIREMAGLSRARDMRGLQLLWFDFMRNIHNSCSRRFWEVFLKIHTFPVNVIDTVLRTTKTTFLEKSSAEWKRFPTSRRTLLQRIDKRGSFWNMLLHTCDIDVTGVTRTPLASGTQSVKFEFLDPVWAWLTVAEHLDPLELHWKPAAQNIGVPRYGGGVQYGEFFKYACRSCPEGGHPMCISVHWDGTSGGGISAAPICIGVVNTNSCSAETQCCIGYMPTVPDQARKEFSKTEDATKLKFHLRQQCCKAIMRVLENAAAGGVLCRLRNKRNVQIDRLLFPRLAAMNFDQPEAQLFFGASKPILPCTLRLIYMHSKGNLYAL